MSRTLSKTVDSKGRLILPKRYANRTVLVREVDETEVVVTLARVIPEREAWLLENPKANESLDRALAQARNGRLVKGPDLDAASDLAEQLEDG